MNEHNPNYRESVKHEALKHDLSKNRVTLDKLVDHATDDRKEKREFAKTLEEIGFEKEHIDIRRVDGKRLRPLGKLTLYERVHNNTVEIVSPVDLETGRHVTSLYVVDEGDIDEWHERLALPTGSYLGPSSAKRVAGTIAAGGIGAMVGAYLEPWVDYLSQIADMPPMGLATTAFLMAGAAAITFLKTGKSIGYLKASSVAQGHAANVEITKLKNQIEEYSIPPAIQTRVEPDLAEPKGTPHEEDVPVTHSQKRKITHY